MRHRVSDASAANALDCDLCAATGCPVREDAWTVPAGAHRGFAARTACGRSPGQPGAAARRARRAFARRARRKLRPANGTSPILTSAAYRGSPCPLFFSQLSAPVRSGFTSRPSGTARRRCALDYARRDPLYPAFVLLLVYGLRREVLGLRWEDVDLQENVIRVDWQLQRINGKLTRTPVKTDAGRRALPLLPIARQALLDPSLWQGSVRRRAGTGWQETGYVFTTRSGQPIEPRNLSRSFVRLVKDGKLWPIRVHDLRHTVASLLKKLRTAPNDAKEILGHARISTTLEIYTAGVEDDQRAALDRISDVLFGSVDEA